MLILTAISRLDDYCKHGGKSLPQPADERSWRGSHGAELLPAQVDQFRQVVEGIIEIIRTGGIAADSLSQDSAAAMQDFVETFRGKEEQSRTGDVLNLIGWWVHIRRADLLFHFREPDALTLAVNALQKETARQHLAFIEPSVKEVPVLFKRAMSDQAGPNGWHVLRMMLVGLRGMLDFSPLVLSHDQAAALQKRLTRCTKAEEYLLAYDSPLLLTDERLWAFYACTDLERVVLLSQAQMTLKLRNQLVANLNKSRTFGFCTHRDLIAERVAFAVRTSPLDENALLMKLMLHYSIAFSDLEVHFPQDTEEFSPVALISLNIPTYKVFEEFMGGLESLMVKYAVVNLDIADLTWREYRTISKTTQNVRFGYLFHILSCVLDSSRAPTREEIRAAIRGLIQDSDGGVQRLQQSEVHRYFSMVAQVILEKFGDPRASQTWEALGLIVSPNGLNDESKGHGRSATAMAGFAAASGITSAGMLVQREYGHDAASQPLTEAPFVKSGRRKQSEFSVLLEIGWSKPFDFDRDYALLIAQTDWGGRIRIDLDASAAEILTDLSGKKTLKSTLSTRIAKIQSPRVCRTLIAQRVILFLAKKPIRKWSLAERLGYWAKVKRARGNEEKVNEVERAKDAFDRALQRWHLQGIDFERAWETVSLTQDVTEFLGPPFRR